MLGHVVRPMTKMMMNNDWPKIEAREIARTSHGITRPQPVIRINNVSVPPPR